MHFQTLIASTFYLLQGSNMIVTTKTNINLMDLDTIKMNLVLKVLQFQGPTGPSRL